MISIFKLKQQQQQFRHRVSISTIEKSRYNLSIFYFLASSPNQVCLTASWNSSVDIAAGDTSAAGSTYDKLIYPADVKYDGYGYLYVADTNNHRIMRFPPGLCWIFHN